MPSTIPPLDQENRPPCSVALRDADLSLDNANWTKGLQSMSDWIWSGNLNPAAFPNHLARYFLQIPAIFEQQLNFSTTLIFDEPSFRNGIQVSGFVDRVSRELVISLVAQRRHSWYSMTHHAVLGYFTAKKHGLSDDEYAAKWSRLTEYGRNPDVFTPLEQAILQFADAFATDPKSYSDDQYENLRTLLTADNVRRYPLEARWMDQLNAARAARAAALARDDDPRNVDRAAAAAANEVPATAPDEAIERMVDAQIVELAFLCLQFVALTGVFSGLNVPDEPFLAGVMESLLPDSVIERLNEFNTLGGDELPPLVPPKVTLPLKQILDGTVVVAPAPLKGTRVPLRPYELNMLNDRDKGLTTGGVQVGTYGWSFGYHFPGSLVYALMLHPELARFEAPYSLPLLFNEDEWRNGTQTGGYVSRLLKELVYQKVYKVTRSRYGLEHHTMFLYNAYADFYGVGRPPRPAMTPQEEQEARTRALAHAEAAVVYMLDHDNAPSGVFNDLERAVLTWTERMVRSPHSAHQVEKAMRDALDRENRREVGASLRRLDRAPDLGEDAAFQRLVEHQVAELAMLTGHMDGLGRALTILRLESEDPVQVAQGTVDPATGALKPALNDRGELELTGYFNNRPGLLQTLSAIGVSERALTVNELVLNPVLSEEVVQRVANGQSNIRIDAATAARTGEF